MPCPTLKSVSSASRLRPSTAAKPNWGLSSAFPVPPSTDFLKNHRTSPPLKYSLTKRFISRRSATCALPPQSSPKRPFLVNETAIPFKARRIGGRNRQCIIPLQPTPKQTHNNHPRKNHQDKHRKQNHQSNCTHS